MLPLLCYIGSVAKKKVLAMSFNSMHKTQKLKQKTDQYKCEYTAHFQGMSFSMMIHITDGISLLFFSKQTSSSATTQTWIRPKELMLNVVGNLLSFSVHLVDLWCKGDHITRSSALNPTAPFLARCKFVYIYYFLFTYLLFFFLHLLGVNVMHCLAIMISS